jgi:membrane protein DedA with SNARE-associated domain
LKTIDHIFGWLLILGSAGHTVGTVLWTEPMSGIFIWSLGATLAGALLGVLNLVRAGRPRDRTLALITTIGTALWAALALTFGFSIHNVLDPRPMIHFIVSVVLVIFGVRTLYQTTATSKQVAM